MMMLSLSRWFFLGLLLSFGWTGTTAHAASGAELRAQVKKLQQAYQSKSWQRVSSMAQKLLQDSSLQGHPQLKSRVYLYLGGMLYQKGLKSIAKPAFAQALRLNPASKAPAGSAGMGSFFAKIAANVARERLYFGGSSAPSKPSAPSGGRWHIGFLIGLPVAVVGVAGLGLGIAAGLNAQANAEQANSLLSSARKNPFPDPLITPTINAIHGEAKSYGALANIAYVVGGVLAAGGVGLILWAALSPKPKAVSALPTPRKTHDVARARTLPMTHTLLQAR